ncbi:MAG: VWA domain-containing protein [Bacteroidota bacterium]
MLLRYSEWNEKRHGQPQSTFDTLFDLFQQLLTLSAGDVSEALNWLTQLDERYGLTDENMGIGDFVEELRKRGYLDEDRPGGTMKLTAKSERGLRQRAMEEVFSHLRKSGRGNHKTQFQGEGRERLPETRPWRFGDDVHNLDVTGTLSNAFRRNAGGFSLSEEDFAVYETDHHTSVATVMMIDLSHSMILYGEDRITPARRTAMALSELILTRYPKDTLDIVAFGNEAWEVSIKDLPYLNVGPYYTNTRAGLQRARDILQRRKNRNKQIFMITDGKPSCHIEYGKMYRNAFGLDRKIVNKVLDEAVMCRREGIDITTFMIANDPYLQRFVQQLTEANQGRAYYASLDDLGGFIFEDYVKNRRKRVR